MLISLPLIYNKIKPYLFYGFRLRATLENREVWYAVNEYFCETPAAAIVFYLLPNMSVDIYALSVLGAFVIGFTIEL